MISAIAIAVIASATPITDIFDEKFSITEVDDLVWTMVEVRLAGL